MASTWIKTFAMATALSTCAVVGFSTVAEARHRHYGWHSGWHRDWHRHPVVHYGYVRPATYAYGGYMGAPGCSCPSSAYYGSAPGYYGYAGGGLFGLGFPGGGLFGLGLGPL